MIAQSQEGEYELGKAEAETEDTFDTEDTFVNDKISMGQWEAYCEYLTLLASYLEDGYRHKFTGELKSQLFSKCFEAAINVANTKFKSG